MSIEQYRANVKFLEDRAEEYPHACRTKTRFPDPTYVERLMPGVEFIRAPLGKESEWRFRNEEDMKRFKVTYTTLDNQN